MNVSDLGRLGALLRAVRRRLRLAWALDTVQLLATTPVDEDRSDVRISVLVRRLPEDPETEPPGIVRAITRAQLEAATEALALALRFDRPADAVLHDFFRSRHAPTRNPAP